MVVTRRADIETLAAVPTDPDFAVYQLPLRRRALYWQGRVTTLAATRSRPIGITLAHRLSASKVAWQKHLPHSETTRC